jgi:hypothetical protein
VRGQQGAWTPARAARGAPETLVRRRTTSSGPVAALVGVVPGILQACSSGRLTACLSLSRSLDGVPTVTAWAAIRVPHLRKCVLVCQRGECCTVTSRAERRVCLSVKHDTRVRFWEGLRKKKSVVSVTDH